MSSVVYTIGNSSFGFSIDSIRKRYAHSAREDFFQDVIKTNKQVDEKKLKKVLEKVWDEAFPPKKTKSKGAD